MRPRRRCSLTIPALLAACALAACDQDPAPLAPPGHMGILANKIGNQFSFADPSGQVATYSTNGALDTGNPFFQSLGTNGRSCASCHLASDAFGLSAASAQARFASTGGTDPMFAAIDGANCPTATPADGPSSYSLLLNNGLIRVFMPVPSSAQYNLDVVHDPYGCALLPDPKGGVAPIVSVYRRPLPTTNLTFLSAVMFDGRETGQPLNSSASFLANLRADLAHQAMDATLGHAQAAGSPTAAQLSDIVDFEVALFTAQVTDTAAGVLNAGGANGGPQALAGQTFYPGINDPLGGNPTGAAFDSKVFTIYAPWRDLSSGGRYADARAAVARGEEIFNTHPVAITDVKGLNDALNVPVINGTCSTCHDSPNVGNHSLAVPLDIGTSHAVTYETDPQIAAGLARLSAPDLPVYRLTCTAGPLAGAVAYTSDPAKALLSGRCADVGRGKGPILRGLAARAPYFHNGAAASLVEVVSFYNERFQMGLTDQQKADLVAFLKSL